ncbi:hypothetical protein [Thomasclavelia cocleata]|uniref:hypothetical protein n=1 Tax=Thomasclavelia cocleata TaxID=69824 RepID=UPI0024330239|nr:hypothetical protein [Thomasclavelia cocleata]
MKDLIINDIKSSQEIEEWLKKSSKNCSSAYYYMEDEYSNNPVIRKMENFEIEERMSYSFEKSTFGWFWKNDPRNTLTLSEIALEIFKLIEEDY